MSNLKLIWGVQIDGDPRIDTFPLGMLVGALLLPMAMSAYNSS